MTTPQRTILVAEDSHLSSVILQRQLTGAGYQVILTENGKLALDRLRTPGVTVDLLLSDITMPEMDGIELTRQIRADEKLKKLPIVLLTAMDRVEDKIAGLKTGADMYLYKPYDLDDLLGLVNDLLEKKGTFQLKVVGDNWFEFHLTNSDIFIREVNEVIRAVAGEGEEITGDVEAIVQVINTVRAVLIDPLENQGDLDLTFSYAFNRKNLVLKIEGFAEGYLKQHEPLVDELRKLVEHVKVNRFHNKLLIAKEINRQRPAAPAAPAMLSDLESIESTLFDLESKLVEIKGVIVKSETAVKPEATAAAAPEKAKAAPPAPAPAPAPATAVNASFAFNNTPNALLFSFTPAGGGGKPATFDQVAAHILEQHFLKVNTTLIREMLKATQSVEKNVGGHQWEKNWDGRVQIEISPDQLKGTMTIIPPANPKGKKVTFEYAREVVELYKFDKFDDTRLKTEFGKKSPDPKFVFIEGAPPTPGADASFKHSVFSERPSVAVRRGELLLYQQAPTVGKAGLTVFGKLISPIPGKNFPVAADENVLMDKKKRRFFAAVDGVATWQEGRLILVPAANAERLAGAEPAKFVVVTLTPEIEKPPAYAAELLDLKENRLSHFGISRAGKELFLAFEAVRLFKGADVDEIKAQALACFHLPHPELLQVTTVVEGKKGMFGLGKQDYTCEVRVDFHAVHEARMAELRAEIQREQTAFRQLRDQFVAISGQLQQAATPQLREPLQAKLAAVKHDLIQITTRVKSIEAQLSTLIV